MNIAVYHIHSGYRKVEVWEGNASGERVCYHELTPNKGLYRREKYQEIADFLHRRFGIEAPEYISSARERAILGMRKEAGSWTI